RPAALPGGASRARPAGGLPDGRGRGGVARGTGRVASLCHDGGSLRPPSERGLYATTAPFAIPLPGPVHETRWAISGLSRLPQRRIRQRALSAGRAICAVTVTGDGLAIRNPGVCLHVRPGEQPDWCEKRPEVPEMSAKPYLYRVADSARAASNGKSVPCGKFGTVAGQLNLISALFLGQVNRCVRGVQQRVDTSAVLRINGDTDRCGAVGDGHRFAALAARGDGRRGHAMPDPLGCVIRLQRVDITDEHQKLLATEPSDHVLRPGDLGEQLRDPAQHVVARRMAVGVVDVLEVVEV